MVIWTQPSETISINTVSSISCVDHGALSQQQKSNYGMVALALSNISEIKAKNSEFGASFD